MFYGYILYLVVYTNLKPTQPFLALTKSATSPRAAVDLITRATSAPGTYLFNELLSTPQIQALSTAEPSQSAHLTLLKIFSYGTYSDYTSDPTLPSLSPAQALKLRQLSFLTLAKNPSDLSYPKLQAALSLQDVRELEDLVISAIYAGLITGTLDPYNQTVCVSSVAPLRDLPPNTIPSMLSTLSAWSNRCTTTLASLEAQIASIKAEALRRHRDEQEWNAHVEKLLETKQEVTGGNSAAGSTGFGSSFGKSLRGTLMGKRNAFSEDSDEDMEDEEGDGDGKTAQTGKERSSKKRGFGMGFGK
jgi:COP9 signalosome complex subunit 7